MKTKQVIEFVDCAIMQENSLFISIQKKGFHGNLLYKSQKMGMKWSLLTWKNYNIDMRLFFAL